MPKPPPMPVRKNAGGPPIGPTIAPTAKNATNVAPVVRRLAVAAVDGDAVHAEPGEQHAQVLDVAVLGHVLQQAAGDDDAGHVGGDRQAGQVDVPRRRVEEVVLRDQVGDLQVVDRAGQAEHRDRAVEEQRDAVDPLLRHLDPEADLLQVERTEALLDGDPPRPGAVAGPQCDPHRGRCRASGLPAPARTPVSVAAARCRPRCRPRCCCRRRPRWPRPRGWSAAAEHPHRSRPRG